MTDDAQERRQKMLKDALHHLQSGLYLLDDAGAPANIGAHVDLAVIELERAISREPVQS